MKLDFNIEKRILNFKFSAGTSRGTLTKHHSYLIHLTDGKATGTGEIAPLPKLSIDFQSDMIPHIKEKANQLITNINISSNEDSLTHENLDHILNKLGLNHWPSIRFGLETALLDLFHDGKHVLFDCSFLKGEPIPINGLIWMGGQDFMLAQLKEKISHGFKCIKLKVGAIDLEKEKEILQFIRSRYSSDELELRLDANGAFSTEKVLTILEDFSRFEIHSIEQPIKQGQWESMAKVCKNSPIPIALDEELIGVHDIEKKEELLDAIQPQYIILKPTLIGGFMHSSQWIELAERKKTGWWLTSALESNIGLNAIAQFASYQNVTMPQGLGTGSLYHNNIDSPLEVKNDTLLYNSSKKWGD